VSHRAQDVEALVGEFPCPLVGGGSLESLSILSLLFDPVTPSKLSISAGVSKRFASAACATGGFDEVVVADDDADDDAGPLWLPPPHETINVETTATANAALNWRKR